MAEKDEIDEALERIGLPRTRANYLWVLYNGDIPDDWDDEAEEQIPLDLRLTF